MAIVEDVGDEEAVAIDRHEGPVTTNDLLTTLQSLAKRLALPEDLFSTYLSDEKPVAALRNYHDHALSDLRQMKGLTQDRWKAMSIEQQGGLMMDILRLHGDDSLTSAAIKEVIDEMTSTLNRPDLAIHLLSHPLRALFSSTPHPMLHTQTSRALPRPAGGPDAHTDFHDISSQRFKSPSAWGCHNILSWCISMLPPDQIERRVGLIIPPTLTLMDDWEPSWRGRGIRILDSWIDKIPQQTLQRMGLDKLVLDSLIHTMSIHANPPVYNALSTAMRVVNLVTNGKTTAERYAEVMEKGIIQGWIYAPSGKEGRPVLINIAKQVESMCQVLGPGIVRWLKTIVPQLLGPLQYIPTAAVLPHYAANLSALLCVMQIVRDTNRIPRWRGQIFDVLSRLWVQLDDRGLEDMTGDSKRVGDEVKQLVKDVFNEMELQSPSVRQNEFAALQELDSQTFAKFIQTTA